MSDIVAICRRVCVNARFGPEAEVEGVSGVAGFTQRDRVACMMYDEKRYLCDDTWPGTAVAPKVWPIHISNTSETQVFFLCGHNLQHWLLTLDHAYVTSDNNVPDTYKPLSRPSVSLVWWLWVLQDIYHNFLVNVTARTNSLSGVVYRCDPGPQGKKSETEANYRRSYCFIAEEF